MDKSVKNNETNKVHNVFEKVLIIALVIFSVLAFAVSGVLIYQKRYLTPFWVNGQSMYPTLNKDVVALNGTPYDEKTGSIYGPGATNVDYGVMDAHESAIKKIERFDIVICKYFSEDNSDKIKRVIGLPGETIKFTTNGDLEIKSTNGEFVTVDQPIENKYKEAGSYPHGEVILGNDQYYVLGDNRGHSYDSSEIGPISRSNIEGVVVAIVAHCEVIKNFENEYEVRNIDYFSWPRFM